MSNKSYTGETKIMLRSDPIPIYPEHTVYHGLYKHMEAKDGKFYVWSENIVGGPNRQWRGHNDSYVSIVPAGMEYQGFVVSNVWVDGSLYHLAALELVK